jgi:hypothetical protein
VAPNQRFVLFLIANSPRSLGHGIHFEITLRRNAKGIGHTVEEGKHRGDIHGLCDLWLAPAMIAENLHVFWGGAVGGFCHLRDVVKQSALRRGELRFVEFSFRDRLYCFLVGSLNPQEVGMRVQSIGTTIEP